MRISDWSSDVCSSDLPCALISRLSCLVFESLRSPLALGSSSLSTERASNVVVITKKMIRHRITSIIGTRLISGLSSARRSRMRMRGSVLRRRCGAAAAGIDGVEQLHRLVLHVDQVAVDAGTEMAVEHQCRHRDDHAGGGAHQRLADEEHTSELPSLMRTSYAVF